MRQIFGGLGLLRNSTAAFALLGLVELLVRHNHDLAVTATLASLSLALFGLTLNGTAVASFQQEKEIAKEMLAAGANIENLHSLVHDYSHVKRYQSSFALALAASAYLLIFRLPNYAEISLVPWLLTPITLFLIVVLVRKQLVFGLLLVVRPAFYWLLYGMAAVILLAGETMSTVQAVLFVIALLADEWFLAVLATWVPDIRQLLN